MTPLRRRLIEDMTVRNLAPTTQATYVYQVSMFARHFGESPETLGPEDIRDYQVHRQKSNWLPVPSLRLWQRCVSFITSPCGNIGPWKK